MAFFSFVGRVLFASVFILSAWQQFNDFGTNGGPAAKALEPKLNVFSKLLSSQTGLPLLEINTFSKLVSSLTGLIEPEHDLRNLIAAAIALKGVGSLLFILGSTWGAYLLLLHQLMSTPVLHDFYNYDPESEEFIQLFTKFTQSLALLGALLYFIGMKNSTPRRQLKKKAPKSKAQ